MPRASSIEGIPVLGEGGRRLGEVTRVLFHEQDPRLVGFEVERSRLWKMIPLRTTFVPFADVSFADEDAAIEYEGKRLPVPQASARATGIDWDTTVVWRGMSVRTHGGRDMGRVRDVVVGRKTGSVKRIVLTDGTTSEVAVGKTEIEGDLVTGFDGATVLVEDAAYAEPTTGGIATVAGKGTAVAGELAGRAVTAAARASGRLAAKAKKRFQKAAKEWKELAD